MTDYIHSVTGLNDAEECQLKFARKHIERKPPETDHASLEYGRGIHSIIAEYLMGAPLPAEMDAGVRMKIETEMLQYRPLPAENVERKFHLDENLKPCSEEKARWTGIVDWFMGTPDAPEILVDNKPIITEFNRERIKRQLYFYTLFFPNKPHTLSVFQYVIGRFEAWQYRQEDADKYIAEFFESAKKQEKKIAKAVKTGEFKASPGAGCSACSYPLSCPVPEATLVAGKQNAELADTLCALEAKRKALRKIMAGICKADGNVRTTDESMEWGYFDAVKTSADVMQVIDICDQLQIDYAAEGVVKCDITKLKKISKDKPEFDNTIHIEPDKPKFGCKKVGDDESEEGNE